MINQHNLFVQANTVATLGGTAMKNPAPRCIIGVIVRTIVEIVEKKSSTPEAGQVPERSKKKPPRKGKKLQRQYLVQLFEFSTVVLRMASFDEYL